MQIKNKVELSIDGFEKCSAYIDADCPLGQLFDFATALKNFIVQKIQEAEKQQASKAEEKAE
jgi:hypothetical protein